MSEIKTVIKNQGYHLSQDGSWRKADRRIGPVERYEEMRAERIDALVAERQRIERRYNKGY